MKTPDHQQEKFLRNVMKSGLKDERILDQTFSNRVMRDLYRLSPSKISVNPIRKQFYHFFWLLLIPLLGSLCLIFLVKSAFISDMLTRFEWINTRTIFLITILFYFHIVRTLLFLGFFGWKKSGFKLTTLYNDI